MSETQRHPPENDAELVAAMLESTRLGKWPAASRHASQLTLSPTATPRQLALGGRVLEIAGAWTQAGDLYRRFAEAEPRSIYPRFRLCQVRIRAGLHAQAREVLRSLKENVPTNARVRSLQALVEPTDGLPPGLWRRWFDGAASWHEGADLPQADMAVVVIGFRNQPGLSDAVRSLLDQDERAEIVVVNTGGGTPEAALSDHASRLRIVTIDQPLYAGAARNIGIDASTAPHVAFLAGDCRARPGWISARLAAHRRGARAVASAIAPPDLHDSLAMAEHLSLFGSRSPQVPPTQALRYGASYDRQVFREFGYFDPALRISEDTDFARRVGRKVFPSWVPAVQTEHNGPSSLTGLARDMFSRGRRAARQDAKGALTLRDGIVGAIRTARQRHAIGMKIAGELLQLQATAMSAVEWKLRCASAMYGAGLFTGRLNRQPVSTRRSHFREDQLLAMARGLIETGSHDSAWMLGDAATLDMPDAFAIHGFLAQAARDSGDMAAFELAAFDCWARNPQADSSDFGGLLAFDQPPG